MSKFSGKIATSSSPKSASKIRLSRKNSRPEVVIVSPKTTPRLHAKSSHDYHQLGHHRSDSSSLSDSYILSKYNQRFPKGVAITETDKKPELNNGDASSMSSVNVNADNDMKTSRHDSETYLPLKLDPVASQHRMSLLRTNWAKHTTDVPYVIGANITESDSDMCGKILFVISWIFIVLFFPISIFLIIKVVQEYE